jgi:UDP-N-acetylglucosamine diphosphorylase / glucose-1-phosphate thymidylyltransferase / UDP-N-acetylgalactosamine diphosphorylase / glucosamine-1-phosphate N-acetyltransferase / galactosamine-1-phosphate N-acetyltransferase
MYSNTVVILAAGRGTRMGCDIPKVMLQVAGKPILQHVIEFWENEGASQFIFVLGHQQEIVRQYLINLELSEAWTYIIQPEQKGIANAISLTAPIVPDRFIVALGDCLNIGKFQYPANMIQGYGIWQNEYKLAQNYGCNVIVVNGYIVSVFEKPPMDYAGMGTYFFDERVFNYIKKTPPGEIRNEVEISDVITNMVRDGQLIKAVPFVGHPINCTYPTDIEKANYLIKDNV